MQCPTSLGAGAPIRGRDDLRVVPDIPARVQNTQGSQPGSLDAKVAPSALTGGSTRSGSRWGRKGLQPYRERPRREVWDPAGGMPVGVRALASDGSGAWEGVTPGVAGRSEAARFRGALQNPPGVAGTGRSPGRVGDAVPCITGRGSAHPKVGNGSLRSPSSPRGLGRLGGWAGCIRRASGPRLLSRVRNPQRIQMGTIRRSSLATGRRPRAQ